MGQSIIQRSFAGGELAPALHARADQVKYVTGLRTCRNFLVRREGGVDNRAGWRFVKACKSNAPDVMLLRYLAPIAGESVLIEAGVAYMRFYSAGGALTVSGVPAWNSATPYVQGDLVASGGVNYYAKGASTNQVPPDVAFWHPLPGTVYEIPTPYGVKLFNWAQSGTVITLTHPDEPPRELVRLGPTRWIIRDIVLSPTIGVPGGVGGTAGAVGTLNYQYIVTAVSAATGEESVGSAPYTIANHATPTAAAPNSVTWSAVTGAGEYNIYEDPFGNGTFGYIGTATGALAFKDAGVAPNFIQTPPLARVLFNAVGTYPTYAAYHQQRRWFANSTNEPESVWGSRIGFYSNFSISSPLQDDDAVTFRLAGNNQHPIRGLLGLKALILLTEGGEWTVTGGGPRLPITPTSIDPEQQTYVGVAPIVPVVVGNAILYVQARGTTLRDLQFDLQVEGLAGRDLTIFAAHLFDGYTLTAIAYQHVPHSIIWCARSDGTLLGLTYLREQEVWGWHRHDTGAGGIFEKLMVVPEYTEDVLYAIVRRTINGATVRYIERLATRQIRPAAFAIDSFFVDAGLSYSGAAASTFTGLDHLEGQTVAVLGDGKVVYDGDPAGVGATTTYKVTAGTITLSKKYSNVHIGLPIRYGDLETLDLDVQGSDVRDKRKRVGSLTLLVDRSSRSFWAGPDVTHLRQFLLAPYDVAADEYSGPLVLPLTSDYNDVGRVVIRQVDPLPLTILGIIPNVTAGG